MVEQQAQVVVVHLPSERRFEAMIGTQSVGKVDYVQAKTQIAFLHTEVMPEHKGAGIGSVLARTVLDYARAERLAVIPACPFIEGWMERHHEYDDLPRSRL